MSINDPQWGNSHRPEQKEPEQVPETTGTEPVQPEEGIQDSQQQKRPDSSFKPPPQSPPPEGPPDLEELWQQLVYKTRCKIARVFGKEMPKPPEVVLVHMPEAAESDVAPLNGWQALSFKSWAIGVSLIIGAWLVSGFYLVDTQQRGVLSRFGQIVSIEDPGWHWRWPYPIDSVRLINITADRTLEVGLSPQKGSRLTRGLLQTADGNLVGVSYSVIYQVADPVAYTLQADAPVDLLALLAEDVLRDAVAGQTLATVLSAGNQQTAPTGKPFLNAAQEKLQHALDPFQMGVIVKRLEIREAQLPAVVLQSVKEAERQEQARAKTLRDAQAAAAESLIQTRRLAAKLQDESTAYAQAVENSAQTLRNRAAGSDTNKAQAQKELADKVTAWRQQYPLVFASQNELQKSVTTTRSVDTAKTGKEGASWSGPESNSWRDREIMRSRDRVDRPGSGS